MNSPFSRRTFIQFLSAMTLLPGGIQQVFAKWPASGFEARAMDAALQSITGENPTSASDQINIKVPSIAENGAVVPVTVTTTLADVRSISLLVSNNPGPLVSTFQIGPNIEPYVSTRVKMAKTSDIVALVETGQGFFTAAKEVKVTIGGCGG